MLCLLEVVKVPLGEKSYKMELRYVEVKNPPVSHLSKIPLFANWQANLLDDSENRCIYVGY